MVGPDGEGIEVHAEFPGGQKAFANFVRKNLNWPDGPGTFGKVLILFVIEKNGRVSNVKAVKKLSPKYHIGAVQIIKIARSGFPEKEKKLVDGSLLVRR